MWFDIAMDQIAVSKELQRACQLLQEMPNDHLVQRSPLGIWIFGNHVSSIAVAGQGISSLDEQRQVPQSAILHDQVDVRGGFMAIDECDNVGMVEALEDIDLGGKVVLEFLVELRQIDGLDGNESP